MTLRFVADVQFASLADLVDAMSVRTGAWIVVERYGTVLTHGAGRSPCPQPVAIALLSKHTRPLRTAMAWGSRKGQLRGSLDGAAVTAVTLGQGATAWFVGGEPERDKVSRLAAALDAGAHPVTDALVESLLHPRGPARSCAVPAAVLAVLVSDDPLPLLARAALRAVAGTAARVHTEPDVVVVVLPIEGDVSELSEVVRTRCPDAVTGVAAVQDDALDWTVAARVARGAAGAARRLGLPIGCASAPAVAAELVIHEAHEAVAALARELGRTPLDRLVEHDARTSADLVGTLRAWCAAGCDVAAAAAQLYVHTNTLRYRLRRASTISGLDLADPRHVLALRLLLA